VDTRKLAQVDKPGLSHGKLSLSNGGNEHGRFDSCFSYLSTKHESHTFATYAELDYFKADAANPTHDIKL